MKHFIFALLFVGLSLPTIAQSPNPSFVSMDSSNVHRLNNLAEPFTFNGTCSADIVKISVDWYFANPDSDTQLLDVAEVDAEVIKQAGFTLGEHYVLKKFTPGSGAFIYRIFPGLANLNSGTNHYVVTGETKSGNKILSALTVYYTRFVAERAKPVIYLYPESTRAVVVAVAPKEGLKITIPAMGSAWHVMASPEGKLVDQTTGKTWPYLFWESLDSSGVTDFTQGFCLAANQVDSFFQNKLSFMGLSAAEIKDFLEYWSPKLQISPYILIRFIPQRTLDADAPLSITPKPDTVIRVYFDYQASASMVKIPEQVLPKGKRQGFTVIEWGGRLHN